MSDHPSTIEGALKWAKVAAECFGDEPPDMDSVAIQTLAAGYLYLRARAEKAEAMLEDGRKLAKESYEAACQFKARAEKAEAWSAELRQAAQALLDVLPSCRCREAYTKRFLVDPDCEAHDFEPESDRLRAILAGNGERSCEHP